jgi:hypothetical protein
MAKLKKLSNSMIKNIEKNVLTPYEKGLIYSRIESLASELKEGAQIQSLVTVQNNYDAILKELKKLHKSSWSEIILKNK